MAKKTIGIEIDVPVGQAEENVKNLQQRLEELKKTLYDMDEADPNFDKMAKEAAMMEDKIADVNNRVRQLSSDTKNLEGFTATVQGIAGGFAAAQGAAALFSEENEELQKQMLKVQAALTLLNGVQEVANQLNKDSAAAIFLKAQAQKAYNLVVGQSTGVLKGFRIALAATGIGALVLILAAVATNWEKMTGKVKGSIGFLEKFGEVWDKVKAVAVGTLSAVFEYVKGLFTILADIATLGFSGAIEEAKKLGGNMAQAYQEGFDKQTAANKEAREKKLIEATIGDTKRLIQRLEAQGAETYETRRKLLQDELRLLEKGTEEYKDKENEIEVLRLANEKKISDERQKIRDEANKKAEEARKRAEEKRKAEDEKRAAEIKAKEEQIAKIIDDTRKKLRADALTGIEKDLELLEQSYEQQLMIVGDNQAALLVLTEKFEQDKQLLRDKYAEEARKKQEEEDRKAADEAEKKAKERLDFERQYQDNLRELRITSAQGIVSALGTINDAFAGQSERAARKQFAIQKALSLAETVISTYSAAQKAYASQLAIATPDAPIRAAIAAGVAIASGLARAAAISKQQFDSSKFEKPQEMGMQGGPVSQGASTPQLTQDVTRTRLGANEQGELKLRVFVTESDITDTQKRVQMIDRKATVE